MFKIPKFPALAGDCRVPSRLVFLNSLKNYCLEKNGCLCKPYQWQGAGQWRHWLLQEVACPFRWCLCVAYLCTVWKAELSLGWAKCPAKQLWEKLCISLGSFFFFFCSYWTWNFRGIDYHIIRKKTAETFFCSTVIVTYEELKYIY